MQIQVVKSKIHRVTVTEANLNYIGSITIDEDLMDAANIIAGERKFPPHQIADLRAECINEVKRLNGTLTFEEAVEWQNSYSR